MSLLKSSQTRLFESYPVLRIYGTANRLCVLSDGPAAPVGTDPQGLSRVLCLVFKEQCRRMAFLIPTANKNTTEQPFSLSRPFCFFFISRTAHFTCLTFSLKKRFGAGHADFRPLPAPDFRSFPLQIFALISHFATENRRERQRLRVGITSRVRRLSSGAWLRRTQSIHRKRT